MTSTIPTTMPTITLLIGNMHCTSCCDAITSLLSNLPVVRNVSTSLLHRTVTFSIDISSLCASSKRPATVGRAVDQVAATLVAEGGFTIVGDDNVERGTPEAQGEGWMSKLGIQSKKKREKKQLDERRRKHVDHCRACQSLLLEEHSRAPAAVADQVFSVQSKDTHRSPTDILKTTVSISGMTCASCTSAITTALETHPEVKEVSVSLTNSAGMIRHRAKLPTAKIKSIVEDLGYDVEIVDSVVYPPRETQTQRVETNRSLQEQMIKTTFSIEGMTCASCTSSITSTLENNPDIQQVDVNLISSSGTVRHKTTLSPEEIKVIIEDMGYDAEAMESEPEVSASKSSSQPSLHREQGQTFKTTLVIGGMTCASCTSAITNNLSRHPQIYSVDINLLASAGIVLHDANLIVDEIKEMVDDMGFEAAFVSSSPVDNDVLHKERDVKLKSVFSIEGMTCASCSGAIKAALEGHKDIESVSIDLLNNQGTIVHTDKMDTNGIKDLIEDVGYGAELSSTEKLVTPSHNVNAKEQSQQRTVRIRVEGLFCEECVHKINSHLSRLPLIAYTPISLHNPTISATYKPHDPLNIRSILKSLTELAPEFEASVQKAQTLSERSKQIQRREVKLLASHLIVAVLFAIPTFIIAIVGMILVPKGSPFKASVMASKWGAANLGTLILWPLATVVQFGVGRLFYRRSFASMWPHLRSLLPTFLIPRNQRRLTKRQLSWKNLFSFGSMDLLVALSTSVSYIASIAMLIIDVRASPTADTIGTYFDSCVFLIMFILLGRTLEAYAKSRTTDAVSLLGGLRPDTALLVTGSGVRNEGHLNGEKETEKAEQLSPPESTTSHEETVIGDDSQRTCSPISEAHDTPNQSSTRRIHIDHLEFDDLILLPPGSLPPTDAVIVSGNTTFDESSLTGESRPIHKSPGDEIFTGTTNLKSAVIIRVTRLGGDTMIEKIIRAVSDAASRKAPLERLAERLTGVFVPVIVYLSLIVLAVWLPLTLTNTVHPETSSGGKVFFAIEFAIATLVVACPCGIGLAVPCANAVGNGVAAKAGILASGGGEAFLGATRVQRVVFDKTGTLTVGRSEVMDEVWLESSDEDKKRTRRGVLELERGSTHPLAVGIVQHLERNQAQSNEKVEVLNTMEVAGRGLKASIKVGSTTLSLLVGNVALLTDHGATISEEILSTISQWSEEAKSVVLVASTGSDPETYSISTLFSLSDPPRPESASVISALKARGISVSMLSGDNEATARAVGKMLGLSEDEVKGGVGPEGKAEVIRVFQEKEGGSGGQHAIVMFVGDGLNDAVALAASDVSVAMGHGSQATLASSDFVLLSSSLSSLQLLLQISRKVINRQKLNLGWAIVFNVVCLPFAAGVFYGAGGIKLSPVWSAVLMAASSVSVVCSSLAMRWGW